MSRIFISYKRVDKDKVFKIKDQIESALGEKCWIDLDGIESDAQFKHVIIKAINESEIVLFMYSKTHSKIKDFEKDWTVRELNFAQKKGKRIVFINLDRSVLTDIFEFDFGNKQQVDGLSKESLDHLFEDMIKWLGITKQPKKENVTQAQSDATENTSKEPEPIISENQEESSDELKRITADKKIEKMENDEGCLLVFSLLAAIGLIILYPAVWFVTYLMEGYSYPGLWSVGISWVIMFIVGLWRVGTEESTDLRKSIELWILLIITTITIYCINYV